VRRFLKRLQGSGSRPLPLDCLLYLNSISPLFDSGLPPWFFYGLTIVNVVGICASDLGSIEAFLLGFDEGPSSR
jgi:hypothetical protein